jgi:hypothetical protein
VLGLELLTLGLAIMPGVTSIWWCDAGCALLLAACIDDRHPGVVEPSPAARTAPAGDILGLRGAPMGEGGSAGTTSSSGNTPAANGTSARPTPTGMLSSNRDERGAPGIARAGLQSVVRLLSRSSAVSRDAGDRCM